MEHRHGHHGIYLIFGLLFGGILGILFAPKTGKETREIIKETLQNTPDTLENSLENTKESAEELIAKTKEQIEGLIANVSKRIDEKLHKNINIQE